MIEGLRIQDLGVIADADLALGPGLNVVTGETGAGKTMVVTALGLLLGSRADAALVRAGAPRARVEARLHAGSQTDALAARLDGAGGVLDEDGSLVVGRLLLAGGGSRASAGGAGVPVGVLGELMSGQVVVHGQADQQRLLHSGRQRDLLDASGPARLQAVRDEYRALHSRLAAVQQMLAEITERSRERAREADLLRLGLDEISHADPQSGEDVALRDEERRLAHADGLRRAAEEARLTLAGDDAAAGGGDALTLVAAARASLAAQAGNDPALDAIAESLAGASYVLADAAADIASYAASVETDPARLQAVSERRAVLAALTRKYGETVDDVLRWAADAHARLAGLDGDESRLSDLRQDRDRLAAALDDATAALTRLRLRAARGLGGRVSAELAELAMPGTSFAVLVEPLAARTSSGADEVTFVLKGGGGTALPLARAASGGELSRVMLALELCLAADAPAPTLVFDEVDAGVGGRAAGELGRRLARLAASTQVVVVTHLPQVAAYADHHLVVTKSEGDSVTTSGVRAVEGEDRLRELSRMLAGLEDSSTALAHARELVEVAQRARSTPGG